MSTDHRKAAGDKAAAEGLQNTFIKQHGKKKDCEEYLQNGTWSAAWGEQKPAIRKAAPVTSPATAPTISTGTEYQYDLLSDIQVPALVPVNMEPSSTLPVEADHSGTTMSELKRLVAIKANAEDQPMSKVGNDNRTLDGWTRKMLIEYLVTIPTRTPEPVNLPLPVNETLPELVNVPLPVAKLNKQHKGMLPNGRSAKGTPDFNKWFGRVYPSDVAYPAWKYLSKTSTDVANICRAKHDHAANCNKKDSSGVPCFEFSFKEAVAAFKISRPTFDKSIKQLVEIGFIKYVVTDGVPQRGNFVDGRGTPAQYQLSHNWKTWLPDVNKVSNQGDLEKLAALSQKQNPGKPVFTPTSKRTFTSGAK